MPPIRSPRHSEPSPKPYSKSTLSLTHTVTSSLDEPPEVSSTDTLERIIEWSKRIDWYDKQPLKIPARADPAAEGRARAREEVEREERQQQYAKDKFETALSDPESAESIFWRYKRIRRLWRLEHGFATDEMYRRATRPTVSEPTEKDMARRPSCGMGLCFSRVRDDINFQYIFGVLGRQPSPWTVPEIRAFYDFEKYSEDWVVERAVTGRKESELHHQFRGKVESLHLRIQSNHARDLKNSEYAALFKAEEAEHEEDVERAIKLRNRREKDVPIVLGASRRVI